ncbi:hypothetical protein Tcan_08439 [Toxocara canis]|uniref:Uncharacterized protein n=1 Tax=Toxocara canis TaxID=6265 RepID=A0A0B2VSZ0_TOXCA|nr:hypothetical protein Tcan_08439 [Toxocara canis]
MKRFANTAQRRLLPADYPLVNLCDGSHLMSLPPLIDHPFKRVRCVDRISRGDSSNCWQKLMQVSAGNVKITRYIMVEFKEGQQIASHFRMPTFSSIGCYLWTILEPELPIKSSISQSSRRSAKCSAAFLQKSFVHIELRSFETRIEPDSSPSEYLMALQITEEKLYTRFTCTRLEAGGALAVDLIMVKKLMRSTGRSKRPRLSSTSCIGHI